jgi:hypothetical protein
MAVKFFQYFSPFACDNGVSVHLRTAKEEANGNPHSGRDRG